MKLVHTFLFCFFTANLLVSQTITDEEINKLTSDLVRQLERNMSGHNVAVADFVDMNDQPCDLGKYLAESFSYALVNQTSSLQLIDRTHLRSLLDEAGIGDEGMVNELSVQRLGRLEGITAIVYGKLLPVGNYVKVFIKGVILEKQAVKVSVEGQLTLTKTLNDFLETQPREKKRQSETSVSQSRSFQQLNIQIALLGCARMGSNVDCQVQITSLNRDDNFYLKSGKTRLLDAGGKSYYATNLSMNRETSTVQVNQSLKANQPVVATVRFANVPTNLNAVPSLELNCGSSAAYAFLAHISNINFKP